MKAAFVANAASAAKIELRDVPKPAAGAEQILVECHYGSLNWGDTEVAHGAYPGQLADPPYVARENFICGTEVSGRIAALGPQVKDLEVGQVVAAMSPSITGAFAEFLVTEPQLVARLPIDDPTADAACLIGVGATAYHLLFSAFQLEPQHTVLVHSISGGVGLAVTQLAADIGATVLGTTSSSNKVDSPMAAGAKKVYVRGQQDFVTGVREITAGQGVDLVIDSLGGELLLESINALALHGRIINIGNTGGAGRPGMVQELHDRLYPRCASYQAFDVFHAAPPDTRRWREGLDYLVERFSDGRFALPVARVFAMDECEEMFAVMRSGSVSGKLCLAIR